MSCLASYPSRPQYHDFCTTLWPALLAHLRQLNYPKGPERGTSALMVIGVETCKWEVCEWFWSTFVGLRSLV